MMPSSGVSLGHNRSSATSIQGQARDTRLPLWPLGLGFLGYPLWWVLGVGDFIWPIVGVILIHYLWTRLGGRTRLPRGFGIWLFFLAWVLVSAVALDSPGRFLGFAYRCLLYFAATAIFVYVYNSRPWIPDLSVVRVLGGFWFVVVAGGLVAATFPLFSIRTPLAYILPGSLLDNEVVREMALRRVTQYDPTSYFHLAPRPSAPFLYTNGWGNAYSLITPLVVYWVGHVRRRWRAFALVAVVALSTVPAALTQNRGMLIGLGVVAVTVVAASVRAGRVNVAAWVAATAVVAVLVFAVSPVARALEERLAVSSSTEDRFNLYQEAIERTLASPILGYAAPRPSLTAGAPSVGTQGQLWMVLFSHGYVAAAAFLVWFVLVFVRSARRRSMLAIVVTGALAATVAEAFYYGFMGVGLMIIMVLAALGMRPVTAPPCHSPADADARESSRSAPEARPGAHA